MIAIHIDHLRPFSETHQVYRAFNHLIAAKHGQLLAVPLHLVLGRFTNMVDGCPVPWEEVAGLIDAPLSKDIFTPEFYPFTEHFLKQVDSFYELINHSNIPGDFHFDRFGVSADQRSDFYRITHQCGARFAFTTNQ